MAFRLYVVFVCIALGACAPGDANVAGPLPAGYVGSTPLRRLSNAEYLRSMEALFPGVAPTGLPTLPPDTAIGGFENDARSLGPSDVHIARYEAIAFAYTALATADDAALARALPCTSWATPTDQDRCGRALVTTFGRRAFRRPLTGSELEQLATRFTAFRTSIDFRAAVQLTMMALVQAPAFLYRIEIPIVDASHATGAPAIVPVDAFALATRLSYLLWQSGPDDELLDLAASGELLRPTVLTIEVDRMLADARVVDTIVDFHRQWLDLDRILSIANRTRDPAQYPAWTTDVQNAEHEELLRFVRWSALGPLGGGGEGTLAELFTSRHGFVNAAMGAVYGVDAPQGGAWAEVELPADQRAGVLTRAAFLAGRSHPGSISPPLRGNFVLERVLCQPHLSPPAAADLSPPQPMMGEGAVTDRVLFERRTASVACAGCHARINGIGFAFEHYDAIGAFHALDHGLPVDASGELIGVDPAGPFTDAIDLSRRLATSPSVAACATDTWVRFALGRMLEHEDRYLRHVTTRAFGESGGTIREVLRAIALSPELRMQQAVQE